MKDILNFIETLVNDMEDTEWTIEKIVEGKKITKDEGNYLEVDNEFFEEQNNYYIKQWVGYCEDDFSGIIFYPIKDNKYLKINYIC